MEKDRRKAALLLMKALRDSGMPVVMLSEVGGLIEQIEEAHASRKRVVALTRSLSTYARTVHSDDNPAWELIEAAVTMAVSELLTSFCIGVLEDGNSPENYDKCCDGVAALFDHLLKRSKERLPAALALLRAQREADRMK